MSQTIPNIFNDELYIHCMSLANLSKGNERYGSVIVRDGEIVGQGFNRAIVHFAFYLERPIRQGMANHAEIEALNNALINLRKIEGSDLYVAGFFPDSEKLFLHKNFTCSRCIPYLKEAGVRNIFVPMAEGWVKRPLGEAEKEAKAFTNGTHSKRGDSIIGNHGITLLEGRLLPRENFSTII